MLLPPNQTPGELHAPTGACEVQLLRPCPTPPLVLRALYLVLDDGIVKAVHLIALCIVVLDLQDTEPGSVPGSAPPVPGSAQ